MNQKAKEEIIEFLNEVLCAELTAINQYFIHSKLCAHWGYKQLHKVAYDESIGEMKHAEIIAERILYLEGMPNMQKIGKVMVGETVKEQMELDLDLEKNAIERLNKGIALCVKHGDNGTRAILESILESEEEHFDFVETQLKLIESLGEKNYLTQKL